MGGGGQPLPPLPHWICMGSSRGLSAFLSTFSFIFLFLPSLHPSTWPGEPGLAGVGVLEAQILAQAVGASLCGRS